MQPLKKNRLLNLALGLAILDGGFVISVQILTFLLTYFFAQLPTDTSSLQSLNSLSKTNFLIAIISLINLSVIVYKIASLANGFKPSNFACYKQAVVRLPFLIMLYLVGCMMFVFLTIPTIKLLSSVFNLPIANFNNILIIATLSLIPYGLLACIFVIYEQKSPLQAIIATYKTIKHRISLNLLAILSIVYAIPFCLQRFIPDSIGTPYLALATSLWFLFCHILTITVYADTVERTPVAKDKQEDAKKTKVIIV